jgi:hypothetical protein
MKITRHLITLLALSVALIHLLFPSLAIDGTTAFLVAIAALPWLGHLFKSVELPGGVKVEYHDLKQVEQQVRESGLLAQQPVLFEERPAYIRVAQEDPNLALAGLRIELEKELVALASRHNLAIEKPSVYRLANILAKKEILPAGAYAAISDLIQLLNKAVHGATVEQPALEWALEVGPELLNALKHK